MSCNRKDNITMLGGGRDVMCLVGGVDCTIFLAKSCLVCTVDTPGSIRPYANCAINVYYAVRQTAAQ